MTLVSIPCCKCGAHAAYSQTEQPAAQLLCYFCIADDHVFLRSLGKRQFCDPHEEHLSPVAYSHLEKRRRASNNLVYQINTIKIILTETP